MYTSISESLGLEDEPMEGFMVLLFILLFILSALVLRASPSREEEDALFQEDDWVETIHDD